MRKLPQTTLTHSNKRFSYFVKYVVKTYYSLWVFLQKKDKNGRQGWVGRRNIRGESSYSNTIARCHYYKWARVPQLHHHYVVVKQKIDGALLL